MKLDCGVKVSSFQGEEKKYYEKFFEFLSKSVGVEIEKFGCWPTESLVALDNIYHLKWRPTDALSMGYPKSGTSWLQLILWNMKVDPDLNHPSRNLPYYNKVYYLEHDAIFDLEETVKAVPSIKSDIRKYCPTLTAPDFKYSDTWDHIPDPRIAKTNLNFGILGSEVLDTCKVIYIIRDPKNHVLSYYHFIKELKTCKCSATLDEFVDEYLNGKLLFGNYFDHCKSVLKLKGHPNLHICIYEDLLEDVEREIKILDKFLGTNLTQQQIKNVIHRTSFKEMKQKDPFILDGPDTFYKGGNFYRKAKADEYKEALTPALISKINKHCREVFEGIDLPYDFQDNN